ncbi:putative protein-S-isoprenylcysteine methyltransferase [Leptolyngbyaceae cyanobacterium JSC-12]|nr:putative protein-S-isoprenylcysteine methyltransferase [Leptolyngbyaceae cyanobacterium JSC-12]
MGLFRDWGFSTASWRGERGEYWVLAQVLLILGFLVFPVYRLASWESWLSSPVIYWLRGWAIAFAIVSLLFFAKGLLDLGTNLTPLPHPRDDGELVQSGIYSIVRHPVYSGVIFAAVAWALYQVSLPHLIGVFIFLVFFDAKARQEENWLIQKHPEYTEYRQRVKKLIPWIY